MISIDYVKKFSISKLIIVLLDLSNIPAFFWFIYLEIPPKSGYTYEEAESNIDNFIKSESGLNWINEASFYLINYFFLIEKILIKLLLLNNKMIHLNGESRSLVKTIVVTVKYLLYCRCRKI